MLVTLDGDTFVDASLDLYNFDLLNEPEGLSIYSITYNNSTLATIELLFDGTDFDSDVNDLTLTINGNELTLGSSITSNDTIITATDDAESIAMSDDGAINENQIFGSCTALSRLIC